MAKVQENSSKFSTREIIMAVIIVLLAVAIGLLAFTQDETNTSGSNSANQVTAPTREQLVIKEWGVGLDQPSPNAALSYKLDEINADGAQSAHLYYAELAKIDSLCEGVELATLVKFTPDSYFILPGNDKKTISEIESNPDLSAIVFQGNTNFNKVGANYYYLDGTSGIVPSCGGQEARAYISNSISSAGAVDFFQVWNKTFTAAE